MIYESDLYVSGICGAIRYGKTDILQYFLTCIDIIPNEVMDDAYACLYGAFAWRFANNNERIYEMFRLLFEHGKFQRKIAYSVQAEDPDLQVKLQTLYDNYNFRLDGPVYNENILL